MWDTNLCFDAYIIYKLYDSPLLQPKNQTTDYFCRKITINTSLSLFWPHTQSHGYRETANYRVLVYSFLYVNLLFYRVGQARGKRSSGESDESFFE